MDPMGYWGVSPKNLVTKPPSGDFDEIRLDDPAGILGKMGVGEGRMNMRGVIKHVHTLLRCNY